MSNSRKQRFLARASRQGHTRTPQPVSSPPRLPCRYPGPGPSVPSPSCPEPRLSRVPKLTPAHNTPHEAISRLFYPQAAPATDYDQEQPHQSTALLRVVMDRPLGAVEAPQLLLLSAPFSACRAPPPQRCSRELQRPPRRVLKPEPRTPCSWAREPAAHPVAAAGWATSAPCTPLPSGVGEIQAQRPAGGHQRHVRRPPTGLRKGG